VVELNRAVAVAMRDGPAAGLGLIDAMFVRGDHLALSLVQQQPERQFLLGRLAAAGGARRRRADLTAFAKATAVRVESSRFRRRQ